MTDFDTFWRDHYPARLTRRGKLVKIGKAPAREQWDKLIKAGKDADELCYAATAYAECQDPEFVKDCFRWLRDGGYEDFYGEVEKPYRDRPAETWTDKDWEQAEWYWNTFGPDKLRNHGFDNDQIAAMRARYLQPREATG